MENALALKVNKSSVKSTRNPDTAKQDRIQDRKFSVEIRLVKSDLVTERGVTTPFSFLQATIPHI